MEAEQKPRISIENDRPMSNLGKPVLILDADKVNLKKVEEFYKGAHKGMFTELLTPPR